MTPREDMSDQPMPTTTQQELPRGMDQFTPLLCRGLRGGRWGGICSDQFPISKRDHDTWHARGYKGTIAIRPSTVYLHHPSSDQAPMSSGLTPTRRPRHHLRSSAQELRFNSDSATPTSPLDPPTSPILPRYWKPPEDSSITAQRRIFGTTILDFNCIDPTDLISLQLTDHAVTANESSCYNQQIELLPSRLNNYPELFSHG